MQLIADSGSTKVDWRAIFNSGEVKSISTEGMNPVFMDDERFITILKEHLLPVVGKDVTGEDVEKIWFYGAGVVGGEINEKLNRCFKAVFPVSECFTASDVLAAARALCGHAAVLLVFSAQAPTVVSMTVKILSKMFVPAALSSGTRLLEPILAKGLFRISLKVFFPNPLKRNLSIDMVWIIRR